MARLASLVGKFALRTIPIRQEQHYEKTGLNYAVYVTGGDKLSVSFLETHQDTSTKTFDVISQIMQIQTEPTDGTSSLFDANWMPVGNFVEYSRYVGKRIVGLPNNLPNEKSFSLFERDKVMFCVTQSSNNKIGVSHYRIFIANKENFPFSEITYGEDFMSATKLQLKYNPQKTQQVLSTFCTKKGMYNIFKMYLQKTFNQLSAGEVLYAMKSIPALRKLPLNIDGTNLDKDPKEYESEL